MGIRVHLPFPIRFSETMMKTAMRKCNWRALINNYQIRTTHYVSFPTPLRSYCANNNTTGPSSSASMTKSYLKDTCGLSGKNLIRISNMFELKSTETADSVLHLFRSYGFSQTHITIIVCGCPPILFRYSPQKIIKPKLDFLLSIMNSESDLIQFVTKDPYLLTRSLEKRLIPFLNMLTSVMGSYQNAITAIKTAPMILRKGTLKCWLPNMELLQAVGVPRNQISKMVTAYCQPLARQHDRFRKAVLKVKEMGFDPSSSSFVSAVSKITVIADSTWDAKFEFCRSLGFSNDEIVSMFKKQPQIMGFSVDHMKRVVEFFVNKLLWSPSNIAITPNVLIYGLEKRIIPRCSVLQALVLKKRMRKSLKLTSILGMTDNKFLKEFVIDHKNEVPEVVDAYQGKLIFDVYNFHLVRKKQNAVQS